MWETEEKMEIRIEDISSDSDKSMRLIAQV